MSKQTNKSWISPVTQTYIQQILPYEFIVDSIALQNKQLYELQKKYISISQITSSLPPVSVEAEKLMKIRQQELIMERKLFMEEGLVENDLEYKKQHERIKSHKIEQNSLFDMSAVIQMDKINVILSSEEGSGNLITKMMQFYKGNQEVFANLKQMKQYYETIQQSIK